MNKFIPFVVQNIYAILFSVVLFFISINIETNLKNTEYIEGKVTSIEPTTVESFRDKFLPLRKYYNVCIKNNAKNGCINVIEPNMGFEPIVHFLSEPNYFFAFWVKKEAFSDVFRIYKALVYEDEQKTKILKSFRDSGPSKSSFPMHTIAIGHAPIEQRELRFQFGKSTRGAS